MTITDPMPDQTNPGPDALRRGLLILVTALIVARPLVPGEDPGLLDLFSTPAGLVLNVLWLLAAIAFAVWRAWAGPGAWRVGPVELGLTAVAAALFVTGFISGGYLRPALLMAWEVLLLAVVFSLVRNLAAEPRDRRGLIAVVLTTAVSAAGFGLYQQVIDLPRLHDQGADVGYMQRTLADRFDVHLDVDSPRLAAMAERLREVTVFGTFASPRAFACYLLLALPILVGLAWTAKSWYRWALGGLVVMVGVALWLTIGPRTFVIEPITVSGIVAVGLLILTLVVVSVQVVVRSIRTEVPPTSGEERIAWEFYLGGTAGLLLAFVLRALGQPSVEVVREGWSAIVRSLIWFPTLGLILIVMRSGRLREGVLVAGWVAAVLAMVASNGLFWPALAQPLWTVAALALPATAVTLSGSRLWQRAQTLWALPVTLALMVAYLLVFVPVVSSAQSLAWVRVARVVFRDLARTAKEKPHVLDLQERINGQIDSAAKIDPLNVEPLLMWADWSRELGLLHKGPKYADTAIKYLADARKLDPLNLEPWLSQFAIHLQYARAFEEQRARHLDDAERVLAEIISRDPKEEALRHFQMAEVCYAVKDAKRGRPHAEEALKLSEGRLSSAKGQQLRTWLKPSSP